MIKLTLQISVLVLLLNVSASAQNKYSLHIKGVDKDSATIVSQTGIQISFDSRTAGEVYVRRLSGYLQSKGYITASIDSIEFTDEYARVVLYAGEPYRWVQLDARHVEASLLNAVGWREKMFADRPLDFSQVQTIEEKMLDHLENNGYPFARVYLDSLQLNNEKVAALLKVNKGPLYTIDSIRVYGDAKISNAYLQRYLDIPNGSIYNRKKLSNINKKIGAEIPIVEHMCGLEFVPNSGFKFFAVPVKVRQFGTFPVRAFAIAD